MAGFSSGKKTKTTAVDMGENVKGDSEQGKGASDAESLVWQWDSIVVSKAGADVSLTAKLELRWRGVQLM